MRRDKEFGDNPFEYHQIIECVFIGGLSDDQIKEKLIYKTVKPDITCLFSLPPQTEKQASQFSFEFLYSDEQYDFAIPKFFSMTFTNEKGIRSYIYCLKMSEEYTIDGVNKVLLPVVIGIKSYKSDINAFKDLFEKIYEIIIKEDSSNRIRDTLTGDEVLNSKRVELLNVFAFCSSLIKPSPHSNIKLVFPQDEDKNKDKDNKDGKQKGIDFYFHSNCEIPCNKNDSDINVLFSILDIEIIIKLVISILLEKQILIIASEAPLLYMLFPALIKLIFPFKWIHSFLPLLPPEQFGFLEAPVPYLIGILSINKDNPEVRSIIESNESKVIVDCCSNEIFGFKEYIPYYFKPNDENSISDRLFYFERTQVFAYDINKKAKKIPKFPPEIDKIIIDCRTNKVLCDKDTSDAIDQDLKALRQKIQLAKNPDIFNLDEFNYKRKKNDIAEDINLDKPFSYNIQNIFFNFFKRKYGKYLQKREDKLIHSMIDTNLFENFIKPAKYQNDSGTAIYNNITSFFNRSFMNCYEVSYNIPLFPIKTIMNELKEKKIKDEIIEKVLNDYGKVKGLLMCDNRSGTKHVSEKCLQLVYLNSSNKGKHQKNKRSQLQKSLEGSVFNFNQIHSDDDDSTIFRFYSSKGFIYFAKRFNEALEKGDINLFDICYANHIYSEIFLSITNEVNAINNEFNQAEKDDEMNTKHNKEETPKNQLIMIEEEENDIDISRGSFRETKFNCSSELNIQMETEEEKPMIKFNEDNSKIQYYLFLVYNIEKIIQNNMINAILEQNNIQWDIDEIIIQLYIKAFHIDISDFPLYHFSLFAERYFKRDDVNANPFRIEEERLLYEISESIMKKIEESSIKEAKAFANRSKTEGDKKKKSILFNRKTYEREGQLSQTNTQTSDLNNSSFKVKDVVPFDISSDVQFKCDSEKNEMQIGKSSIEYKTSTSSSGGNKVEEYYQKIVINTKSEFVSEAMPLSSHIVNQMSELMYAFFLSYEINQIDSVYNIMELISPLLVTSPVKELVSELADFDIKLLRHTSEKIAFWINCFNYLILFTLFYKKWVINNIHDWKYFLKNVHYRIAGMEISFSDIQYILLSRVLFFDSEYKPSNNISKLCIKRVVNHQLISFLLYLPTGILLSPKVVHANEIEDTSLLIDNFKEYLNAFVKIDSNLNVINIPEFLCIVDVKWYEKYGM